MNSETGSARSSWRFAVGTVLVVGVGTALVAALTMRYEAQRELAKLQAANKEHARLTNTVNQLSEISKSQAESQADHLTDIRNLKVRVAVLESTVNSLSAQLSEQSAPQPEDTPSVSSVIAPPAEPFVSREAVAGFYHGRIKPNDALLRTEKGIAHLRLFTLTENNASERMNTPPELRDIAELLLETVVRMKQMKHDMYSRAVAEENFVVVSNDTDPTEGAFRERGGGTSIVATYLGGPGEVSKRVDLTPILEDKEYQELAEIQSECEATLGASSSSVAIYPSAAPGD